MYEVVVSVIPNYHDRLNEVATRLTSAGLKDVEVINRFKLIIGAAIETEVPNFKLVEGVEDARLGQVYEALERQSKASPSRLRVSDEWMRRRDDEGFEVEAGMAGRLAMPGSRES